MNTRHINGFTLVEVMVALVVLSIGLLGVAKLSFSSVQSNSSAYMRTQSSELMQAIVDDMRANRIQAALGSYNIAFGAAAPNPGTDCSQAVCTDTEMATYDVWVWKTRLQQALPNGDGQLAAALANDAAGNQQLTVTVSVKWNDTIAQQTFGANVNTSQIVTAETVL